MKRDLLDTVDRMIRVMPSQALMKTDLVRWRGRAFLILPEHESHHWREVAQILYAWFPPSEKDLNEWQRKVLKIWRHVMKAKDENDLPQQPDALAALRGLTLEQVERRIAELEGERATLATLRRSLKAKRRAEERSQRRSAPKAEGER